MTIAMCCFLIGTILIATAPVDQIYWGQLFFASLITPFGMDSKCQKMIHDKGRKTHI